MAKKLRCYVLLDEQQKKQVNKDFRMALKFDVYEFFS